MVRGRGQTNRLHRSPRRRKLNGQLRIEEPEDRLALLSDLAYRLHGPKDLVTKAIAYYEAKGPHEEPSVAIAMLSSVAEIAGAWHKFNCPSAYDYVGVLNSVKDPELSIYVAIPFPKPLDPDEPY